MVRLNSGICFCFMYCLKSCQMINTHYGQTTQFWLSFKTDIYRHVNTGQFPSKPWVWIGFSHLGAIKHCPCVLVINSGGQGIQGAVMTHGLYRDLTGVNPGYTTDYSHLETKVVNQPVELNTCVFRAVSSLSERGLCKWKLNTQMSLLC